MIIVTKQLANASSNEVFTMCCIRVVLIAKVGIAASLQVSCILRICMLPLFHLFLSGQASIDRFLQHLAHVLLGLR